MCFSKILIQLIHCAAAVIRSYMNYPSPVPNDGCIALFVDELHDLRKVVVRISNPCKVFLFPQVKCTSNERIEIDDCADILCPATLKKNNEIKKLNSIFNTLNRYAIITFGMILLSVRLFLNFLLAAAFCYIPSRAASLSPRHDNFVTTVPHPPSFDAPSDPYTTNGYITVTVVSPSYHFFFFDVRPVC
ncbi:unnamed protein product [Haemonchus placei]|uniref:Late nodulin n=1 Tax=Haemonchus placei TaxID=6290 RepID=A0A0N4WG47_HAEPC|nr:unnamed protein product [Haemonchus placei]